MNTIQDMQQGLYHFGNDSKYNLVPQRIMNYLRLAHSNQLEEVPEDVREFFKLNKASYPKLMTIDDVKLQVKAFKTLLNTYIETELKKKY